MPSRYAQNDPYTYDDSPVLINKPGIRNEKQLVAYERIHVLKRMLTEPPQGSLDYDHLKALHQHLFQDVYFWAGEERNAPLNKMGNQFATPVYIHDLATKLFNNLAAENLLQNLNMELFATQMAHYTIELNVIHPFREGNGRTMRLFLFLLTGNAGYTLAPMPLEKGWLSACIKGFAGDEHSMKELLHSALEPLDLS